MNSCSDICNNMDVSQMHHVRWKKLHSKGYTYCITSFAWHSGKAKATGTENGSVVIRAWGWEEGLAIKEGMEIFGGKGAVLCLVYSGAGCTAVHVCQNNNAHSSFILSYPSFMFFFLLLSLLHFWHTYIKISCCLWFLPLEIFYFSNGSTFFLIT